MVFLKFIKTNVNNNQVVVELIKDDDDDNDDIMNGPSGVLKLKIPFSHFLNVRSAGGAWLV